MNIPKIEEAITLLYQTYIEDQEVATHRGIAITAMNEMIKSLGGDDVVKKIEAVPYSARLRTQHLFEDEPQRTWVGLTADEMLEALRSVDAATAVNLLMSQYKMPPTFKVYAEAIEAKLKEKNT